MSQTTLVPIVRINPSTDVGIKAVAKFGNCFWLRPSSGSAVMLIPVVDGIPLVAEFIHVPSKDVYQTQAPQIGYGSSDPVQQTQQETESNGNP